MFLRPPNDAYHGRVVSRQACAVVLAIVAASIVAWSVVSVAPAEAQVWVRGSAKVFGEGPNGALDLNVKATESKYRYEEGPRDNRKTGTASWNPEPPLRLSPGQPVQINLNAPEGEVPCSHGVWTSRDCLKPGSEQNQPPVAGMAGWAHSGTWSAIISDRPPNEFRIQVDVSRWCAVGYTRIAWDYVMQPGEVVDQEYEWVLDPARSSFLEEDDSTTPIIQRGRQVGSYTVHTHHLSYQSITELDQQAPCSLSVGVQEPPEVLEPGVRVCVAADANGGEEPWARGIRAELSAYVSASGVQYTLGPTEDSGWVGRRGPDGKPRLAGVARKCLKPVKPKGPDDELAIQAVIYEGTLPEGEVKTGITFRYRPRETAGGIRPAVRPQGDGGGTGPRDTEAPPGGAGNTGGGPTETPLPGGSTQGGSAGTPQGTGAVTGLSGGEWHQADTRGGGSFSTDGDAVTISPEPGTSLGRGTEFNAPRQTVRVVGDFMASVRMQTDASQFPSSAGLVVFGPKRTMVRVERVVRATGEQYLKLSAYDEKGNWLQDGGPPVPLRDNDFTLGLTRTGQAFRAVHKGIADGQTIDLGQVTVPMEPRVRMGIAAGLESPNGAVKVTFSGFELRQ